MFDFGVGQTFKYAIICIVCPVEWSQREKFVEHYSVLNVAELQTNSRRFNF